MVDLEERLQSEQRRDGHQIPNQTGCETPSSVTFCTTPRQIRGNPRKERRTRWAPATRWIANTSSALRLHPSNSLSRSEPRFRASIRAVSPRFPPQCSTASPMNRRDDRPQAVDSIDRPEAPEAICLRWPCPWQRAELLIEFGVEGRAMRRGQQRKPRELRSSGSIRSERWKLRATLEGDSSKQRLCDRRPKR